MAIGDTKTFTLEAEEAYGERVEAAIQVVPLDKIPDIKVRKKSKLLVQAMLAMISRIMQKKLQQLQ